MEKSSLNRKIDSAVWILLVTSASYSLALRYDAGYISFFGIPASFAGAAIGTIVNAISVVLIFTVITLMFVCVSMVIFHNVTNVAMPIMMRVGVGGVAFYGLLSVMVGLRPPFNWFYLLAFSFIACVPGIAPYLHFRKEKFTYKQRLTYLEQRINDSFVPKPLPKETMYIVLVLTGLALADQTAYEVGRSEARKSREFLIFHSNPDCLVVRQFGEREHFLCAEFDSIQVLSKFRIVPLKEKSLEFSRETIGTLLPASESAIPESP
jgi:hypothetical protein